jgi:aspartyl-tRNA(Asn)/glutamyl-tRNA(Gln) amidotransferase subunit A
MDAFSSLSDLAQALESGACSATSVTERYLDRIGRLDPILNAFVDVHAECALRDARQSDRRRIEKRTRSALDGLPFAVKDLCEMQGETTTFGSAAWRNRRSTTTATVVQRVRSAGMIVLGKTQMVEFAFGTSGANELMGTPRNPWDRNAHRIPGGSSSGSGVAVAAGLAPAAIGSDTGGSIRIPASLVGITGLKTTPGRVDLQGTLPLSPTLDTLGPMAHSIDDCASLFAVMAGENTNPSPHAMPSSRGRVHGLEGLRVSVIPEDLLPLSIEDDVLARLGEVRRFLLDHDACIVSDNFPIDFDDLGRRCRALIAAEAWRVHAAYIEDADLAIGHWVRERVSRGKGTTALELFAMRRERERACAAWLASMQHTDLIVTPTLPFAACPVSDFDEGSPALGTFTRAVNYLGTCAVSLPAGVNADGMPIGVQFIGKPNNESLLIDVGRAWQGATDWHLRRPLGLT